MGVPVLVLVGFLAAGTVAQPLARIMYALKSVGADGNPTTFQKPYFIELLMFFAMASLIALECCMGFLFPAGDEGAADTEYREMDDAAAGELLDHDDDRERDLLQGRKDSRDDPVGRIFAMKCTKLTKTFRKAPSTHIDLFLVLVGTLKRSCLFASFASCILRPRRNTLHAWRACVRARISCRASDVNKHYIWSYTLDGLFGQKTEVV